MMRRRNRIVLGTLALLAVALVALRVALPYLVRDVINRRMAHMGDYHGHVADVDLHLWRGAYSLQGLRIVKVDGKVPVPLLNAPRTDIMLSWDDLWHGAVRARVRFERPELNFVDSDSDQGTQAGRGVDWRQALQRLIPIRLDEVDVDDGTVTFRNFVSHPRVDLRAHHVDAVINNLTNADRRDGRRVASMRVHAQMLGDAELRSQAKFDPLGRLDDFDFDVRVLHMDLTQANALARAYAHLDFASGKGDFVLQLRARDGALEGYAKPLFHDMKIFSWKQDVEQEHENPLRVAWEAFAQGVTSLFKNHDKDQFATRVPIRGRIDDRKLGVFRAVLNVLHNAFVQAYTPQLEHLRPTPKASDNGGH